MRVAEVYESIQGEGFLTGTRSVFMRASGCNLRCWFCDTPYASWSPEGEDLSVDEILRQISTHESSHVVITGGEPMLFAELIPLCRSLREKGKHITIETAGTLYLPLECDLMSISPKLSNSAPSNETSPRWHERHQQTRYAPNVIRQLIAEYPYQMKFVIDSIDDCEEVGGYLEQLPEISRDRVLLMPQGTELDTLALTSDWLQPYCEDNGFNFCPRQQIEWFGLARGT